jgi:hypothetical protein
LTALGLSRKKGRKRDWLRGTGEDSERRDKKIKEEKINGGSQLEKKERWNKQEGEYKREGRKAVHSSADLMFFFFWPGTFYFENELKI